MFYVIISDNNIRVAAASIPEHTSEATLEMQKFMDLSN